jgi:predicted amidohydrolase YtcJ
VVLSQDIFRINPVEIERTKVRLTIMGGRVVYEEKK